MYRVGKQRCGLSPGSRGQAFEFHKDLVHFINVCLFSTFVCMMNECVTQIKHNLGRECVRLGFVSGPLGWWQDGDSGYMV